MDVALTNRECVTIEKVKVRGSETFSLATLFSEHCNSFLCLFVCLLCQKLFVFVFVFVMRPLTLLRSTANVHNNIGSINWLDTCQMLFRPFARLPVCSFARSLADGFWR